MGRSFSGQRPVRKVEIVVGMTDRSPSSPSSAAAFYVSYAVSLFVAFRGHVNPVLLNLFFLSDFVTLQHA